MGYSINGQETRQNMSRILEKHNIERYYRKIDISLLRIVVRSIGVCKTIIELHKVWRHNQCPFQIMHGALHQVY